MDILKKIGNHRDIMTGALALIGIGLMFFYTFCDTSCSYLKGDIFGIDLKYVGIGYMLAIIVLAFFKQTALIRILLASGIGVEIYLVAFQFREEVFCPFCIAFGATVVLAFILNYEKPQTRGGWRRRIIYGLGEADLPWLGKRGMPLLLFVIIGYLFVILTFSGSATPAYGAEIPTAPSYGNGPYELIIFTDYFCPPCQSVESEMDMYLNEFLSKGGVKVTFVDMPFHKLSPLYAKYFLYVVNAGGDYKEILNARKVLFELAIAKAAATDNALGQKLNQRGVAFTPYDPKPVYAVWNRTIKQFKADATPTCVVKYSGTDIRKYIGPDDIRKGLINLRRMLADLPPALRGQERKK
ncbi:MAG: thioredoxin domain-containing protein [Proteobacteria bacterium]|nr:thioredoxin domain-containing protein [Pseudomonadota bacterium]